jgi:hypothetical protein
VARAPIITLEAIGLTRLSELYELDPDEVVKLMDERNVPLNPGDAFLAVVVLRAIRDLRKATLDLDESTARLATLTWVLVGLTIALVLLGVATLLAA